MPEVEPKTAVDRTGTKLRAEMRAEIHAQAARIDELEKTVKALLRFAQELELDQEAEYMPEGTYHGVSFE